MTYLECIILQSVFSPKRHGFVVHRSASGLPDLLFEMHLCGLHVCYLKKMGQFGFVQTVQDNMKLFSKCQLAGAQRARELHERLLCPSTPDFYMRTIFASGLAHTAKWLNMLSHGIV